MAVTASGHGCRLMDGRLCENAMHGSHIVILSAAKDPALLRLSQPRKLLS